MYESQNSVLEAKSQKMYNVPTNNYCHHRYCGTKDKAVEWIIAGQVRFSYNGAIVERHEHVTSYNAIIEPQ